MTTENLELIQKITRIMHEEIGAVQPYQGVGGVYADDGADIYGEYKAAVRIVQLIEELNE